MRLTPGDPASSPAPRASFSRYEYKYRLPRGLASTVRACVAAHLPRDHYSSLAPDGRYPISSLYLDSADLRLCRESLEGHKNRFKLRIRGYDDHPDSPLFAEIKRRLNTTILKDRSRLARDQLVDLAGPRAVLLDPAGRQFDLYRRLLAARPQALVRYRREAFESDGPSRVRVTFDHDLASCVTQQWRFTVQGGTWRRVLADQVVMEIKFDGRFPGWIQDLVHRFQLHAQSVSKYCLALHAGAPAPGYLCRAAEG